MSVYHEGDHKGDRAHAALLRAVRRFWPNVTWLPALAAGMAERAKLDRRGVAMPQIRKNLDAS